MPSLRSGHLQHDNFQQCAARAVLHCTLHALRRARARPQDGHRLVLEQFGQFVFAHLYTTPGDFFFSAHNFYSDQSLHRLA